MRVARITKTKMKKVWIVLLGTTYVGSYIGSVHSTEQGAKDAASCVPKKDYDRVEVASFVVDDLGAVTKSDPSPSVRFKF